MRNGSVYQRHTRACPRDDQGTILPHRCRGPWAFVCDTGSGTERKRLTRSGFRSRAAAQAALREARDQAGSHLVDHRLTVGDYLATWITGKQALKRSTQSHYRDAIRLYLRPNLGEIPLIDLRAHHLDQMYATLTHGVRGKPLSPASIRRIHACLRSALNTAVKRRLLTHNPALHVELPPERPRRPEPWTSQDCRHFLHAISGDRLALLYRILIVTGMRRGEAIGLRWADIDLTNATIRIAQQITPVAGKATVDSPKTRRGSRVVPIDPDTLTRLRDHLATQRRERRAWATTFDVYGLVFTREDGTALRPEHVTKHFQSLARRHGLPVIRLHDLRHTNATLALQAGIEVKVISERLGHSTTAITQDIYMHVAPQLGRHAADRIADLVSPLVPAADTAGADGSALAAQEHSEGAGGGAEEAFPLVRAARPEGLEPPTF